MGSDGASPPGDRRAGKRDVGSLLDLPCRHRRGSFNLLAAAGGAVAEYN